MRESQEIGLISLKIDPSQIDRIVSSGKLEHFVERVTQIFAADLKSKLVEESVSSINTEIILWEGDEYGTGPRPPIWHVTESIDKIKNQVKRLEKNVRLDTKIMT
ncbi:MAG: hypothetical protein GY874_01240 [Desulfobacteraceae bacterium]|nr:hypothetical protein [Desulfobacteraceae bacterium]